MILTHILFRGIYSSSLAGILPYFNIDHFLCWHMPHSVTSLWTAPLMSVQKKCWWIITSVISNAGWRKYVWCHFTTYFYISIHRNTLCLFYVGSVIMFSMFFELWNLIIVFNYSIKIIIIVFSAMMCFYNHICDWRYIIFLTLHYRRKTFDRPVMWRQFVIFLRIFLV